MTIPPPLPPQYRHHTLPLIVACAIAGAAVLVAVAVYYYHHDPASGGLPCTFKYLTGYDCPGCGSQRALHAMLHGHVVEALKFNPLVFVAAPLAVTYFIAEAFRHRMPRFHAILTHHYATTALLIVVVAWWILRNIL